MSATRLTQLTSSKAWPLTTVRIDDDEVSGLEKETRRGRPPEERPPRRGLAPAGVGGASPTSWMKVGGWGEGAEALCRLRVSMKGRPWCLVLS